MSVVLFLVFGLVVGLIARAVMPGTQSMSIAATTAVGVVGSLLGGFLASFVFGSGRWNEIHAAGLIGSVVGALIVMGLVSFVATRPQSI